LVLVVLAENTVGLLKIKSFQEGNLNPSLSSSKYSFIKVAFMIIRIPNFIQLYLIPPKNYESGGLADHNVYPPDHFSKLINFDW